MAHSTQQDSCGRDLIPAYIDGELDDHAQGVFETHLSQCLACRDELRAHRSFICELDAALNDDADLSVPANFSKVIAARAASDMSGVRSAAENRIALVICVVLAVTGVSLVGETTRSLAFNLGRKFVESVIGVTTFFWTAFYDSVASITVVSRVVSRKLIVETGNLKFVFVLLALAILLLSRLIHGYHRTSAN